MPEQDKPFTGRHEEVLPKTTHDESRGSGEPRHDGNLDRVDPVGPQAADV
jgi:hypothetical protein